MMPEVGQWFVAYGEGRWPGRVETVEVRQDGFSYFIDHRAWPERSTRQFGMSARQFHDATTGPTAWWKPLPVDPPILEELRVSEGL